MAVIDTHDRKLRSAVIGWDVETWSRALPVWGSWLERARPARGLALGERGGGMSLWLALHGTAVVCSDRGGPRPEARDLHARHGVGSLVTYEDQDATAIDHGSGTFDVVIFKSMLGALGTKDRQHEAMAEIHRVLRPGGALLFAENLTGSALHRALRARYVPWDRGWRYLNLRTDADLFARFRDVDVRTTGLIAAFGRSEVQRAMLGRLDGGLSRWAPSRWRYVAFGVCVA